MQITKEFLEKNDFKNISSESPIPTYSNKSGDWNVTCRWGYTDGVMHEFGCIAIDCWKGDGSGVRIIKRASVHGCICEENDLINILKLCNISLEIILSEQQTNVST